MHRNYGRLEERIAMKLLWLVVMLVCATFILTIGTLMELYVFQDMYAVVVGLVCVYQTVMTLLIIVVFYAK